MMHIKFFIIYIPEYFNSHVTFISRQHINEVKLWIIFMSINNVENLVSKTSNKI